MKFVPFALLAVILSITFAGAQPLIFEVGSGPPNQIRFQSHAPLETVIGTTDQVHGSITADPSALGTGLSAKITVDAKTIRTGNSVRDGHMRDNHLETDEFPAITFALDSLRIAGPLKINQPQNLVVLGRFTLHGVTRGIGVPVEVTYSEEATVKKVHVTGSFKLALSDYKIPRPQFLVMRLDETQCVTVDFWGVAK